MLDSEDNVLNINTILLYKNIIIPTEITTYNFKNKFE